MEEYGKLAREGVAQLFNSGISLELEDCVIGEGRLKTAEPQQQSTQQID